MHHTNKGILVVSFGTSFPATREKTIDAIEASIGEAFPDYKIYRGWTSGKIRKKLYQRDGIYIPSVKEALLQMKEDQITQVAVQPTYVIPGFENDHLTEELHCYSHYFTDLRGGSPLLCAAADYQDMACAIQEEFQSLEPDAVLLLMGHGTAHEANTAYEKINDLFQQNLHTNIFLGTVEAGLSKDGLLEKILKKNPSKVVLAPFMIVAGDHALNDMAGDSPKSWKSQLEAAGLSVESRLKGLGEYAAVHQIFIRHLREVLL